MNAVAEVIQPSPSEKLLERLKGVVEINPHQWKACCPAHDDRHPSPSIKQTEDGTLLIKCWAGCSNSDIISNVGLTLADLFDRPLSGTPVSKAN